MSKSKRITLTVPEELYEAIEKARASEFGKIKRSEFVKDVLLQYFKNKKKAEQEASLIR